MPTAPASADANELNGNATLLHPSVAAIGVLGAGTRTQHSGGGKHSDGWDAVRSRAWWRTTRSRGSSGGSSSGGCRTSSSGTTRRRRSGAGPLPLLVVGLPPARAQRPRRLPSWSLTKNLVVAGVRRRRRRRHVGRRQPPARPPAGSSARTRIGAGRAGRVHRRPRRPVAARRAVGRRRCRRWSTAVAILAVLWAITSYGVAAADRAGRGSARWPQLAAAVQRRRPGPAAAAAVHDVPVHQRRGLAGRRHAHRRRVRRRARHLLRPRRGVRAVPHPGADALAEPLRLVGARSPTLAAGTPGDGGRSTAVADADRRTTRTPTARRCASASTSGW